MPALPSNLLYFLLIGNATSMLQEAQVHYISRNVCTSEMSFGSIVPVTSFCAGDEDGVFDTCRVRPNIFWTRGNLTRAFVCFLVKSWLSSPKKVLNYFSSFLTIPTIQILLLSSFALNLSSFSSLPPLLRHNYLYTVHPFKVCSSVGFCSIYRVVQPSP